VDEGYSLALPGDGSPGTLTAATVWGALHGLQTLSQLVRYDFDARAYWVDGAPVAIDDAPAFSWRGLMVDPARQFLPIATLRAVVDSLTIAKLNTLHVHLLDCDSFGIEVAPPFESLWAGAFSPRERYTGADLAGLVDYARVRGVRVVYEFVQPGHMGAMCVGHPELCPTPKCDPAYGSDVLDPSSNATLPAMQAVVDALVAASVDSVLHLGGDEVGDACWLASPAVRAWMAAHNASSGDDIYEYFVERSNAMALAAGKSPMRWEEVWKHFRTALDPRTIVHAWLSSAALLDAANNGYRTVYSVNDHAYYLDYLDVQWSQVYATDILEGLTNHSARPFILGGQLCAWGETMDAASVLSIVWPRAAAAAERLWSYNFATSAATDYDTVNRMAALRCELLERGVPAPLPGASNAGDLRPAWTVGSCDGGYKALC
jgi:hexosaminidase